MYAINDLDKGQDAETIERGNNLVERERYEKEERRDIIYEGWDEAVAVGTKQAQLEGGLYERCGEGPE